MADWKQDIDDLFRSQGFEKKTPELTQEDQLLIQEFLDNIGKPAFENICDRLNSYLHIKAEVLTGKKSGDQHMETVELSVAKMNQPRLTYRLSFLKKREEGICLQGEYSTPNIYGENTRFHKSGLDRGMAGTTEEQIANDFSDILVAKF